MTCNNGIKISTMSHHSNDVHKYSIKPQYERFIGNHCTFCRAKCKYCAIFDILNLYQINASNALLQFEWQLFHCAGSSPYVPVFMINHQVMTVSQNKVVMMSTRVIEHILQKKPARRVQIFVYTAIEDIKRVTYGSRNGHRVAIT